MAQQHFAETFYHYTKALDPYRLVSTNDGWEAVKPILWGIHDYESDGEVLAGSLVTWLNWCAGRRSEKWC